MENFIKQKRLTVKPILQTHVVDTLNTNTNIGTPRFEDLVAKEISIESQVIENKNNLEKEVMKPAYPQPIVSFKVEVGSRIRDRRKSDKLK